MFCLISSRNNEEAHQPHIAELKALFPEFEFVNIGDFSLQNAKFPLVLFPCSGGTENAAIQLPVEQLEAPIYIYSVPTDNSSAAALEISFALKRRKVPHFLSSKVAELQIEIEKHRWIKEAVEGVQSTRLLEIGGFSDWLINEHDINGAFMPKVTKMDINEFLAENFERHAFNVHKSGRFSDAHFEQAEELYSRLKSVLLARKCTGLTVECFTLLGRVAHFAACVPYAVLQTEGYLTACEGEVSSLVGMVFLRHALGEKGIFMCNFLDVVDGIARFAHCTAPLCGLDECGAQCSYALNTHYETGEGSCVTVELQQGRVVVFKLRPNDGMYWLADGEVVSSPGIADIEDNQCKTQVTIRIGARAPVLGNHHLVCKVQDDAQIATLRALLAAYGFLEVRE